MIAGKIEKGSFCSLFPFDDSDIYKIIEGASFSLQSFSDPTLSLTLDTLIYYIGKAQEPDGYLFTNRTIDSTHLHEWVGKKRWEKDPELSHELYNLGHLYEAAVAHYLATGKRTLLDIAIKSANLVYNDFIGKKLPYYPGHQVIEMGLAKLYRVTNDPRYLELARYFLDIRKGGEEYNQADKPVTEQDKIVGHAVRATYMYSGMADVSALTGDMKYAQALYKIWNDLLGTKYYITGGIGSSGSNEGFGPPYELPNLSAYCETCASIGLVFWNYRMFLLTGESKYFDVLEHTLYNALLSGISLSGDRFFYSNVLESRGQHERSAWFGCACCPSNICRFIPSIPGYMYATKGNELYTNLYINSTSEVEISNQKVSVGQITDYPWNGKIEIRLSPEKPADLIMKFRIPSWVNENPVPGNLYHYSDDTKPTLSFTVNGKLVQCMIRDGYASIERKWVAGDVISFELPMEVRKIFANPAVIADRDHFSLQRGPLMYCLEWPDNTNEKVMNKVVDPHVVINASFRPELLNGVEVLSGEASVTRHTDSGIERAGTTQFMAIPYFAWANRGPGEMEVWIPSKPEASRPDPLPTIASSSKIQASTPTKEIVCINDQELPLNSNDHEISYYHWWPKHGVTEWIEYDFAQEQEVSESSVYWFDDGPSGGCRIPSSWKILFKQGSEWVPVENTSAYTVTKDALDVVRFKPVKTPALRIEVELPKDYSSGLYEWIVK